MVRAYTALKVPVRTMPRLCDTPGSVLRLLVLSTGQRHCVAIDLASGALVRAWSAAPIDQRLGPYDIVEVTVASDPDVIPDPTEPEAVVIGRPPKPDGRMTGRAARRLIRPLLYTETSPLLGFHGPAMPFWERKPDQPSVTVVEPKSALVVTQHGEGLWCHFLWGGRPQVIACRDPRFTSSLQKVGHNGVRFRPGTQLVVALSPPVDGHCYKIVESIVPRR
jgi:hypothetical protein